MRCAFIHTTTPSGHGFVEQTFGARVPSIVCVQQTFQGDREGRLHGSQWLLSCQMGGMDLAAHTDPSEWTCLNRHSPISTASWCRLRLCGSRVCAGISQTTINYVDLRHFGRLGIPWWTVMLEVILGRHTGCCVVSIDIR
jgi:hypothetical protein